MNVSSASKTEFFGEVLPNLVQGAAYCILTHRVEAQQWYAERGLETYTWAMGHLSCFGVAGWWTAWLLALNALADIANRRFGRKTRSRPMRLAIYLLVPALLTLHEFTPFFSPGEAVFDAQDIVCYALGTLAVFAVAAPLRRFAARVFASPNPEQPGR